MEGSYSTFSHLDNTNSATNPQIPAKESPKPKNKANGSITIVVYILSPGSGGPPSTVEENLRQSIVHQGLIGNAGEKTGRASRSIPRTASLSLYVIQTKSKTERSDGAPNSDRLDLVFTKCVEK